MKNVSIKWQLLAISVAFVAIPVLIVGILSYEITQRETFNEIEEKLSLQAIDAKVLAESEIGEVNRIITREEVLVEQRLEAIVLNVQSMLSLFDGLKDHHLGDEHEILYQKIREIEIGRSGYVFIINSEAEFEVTQHESLEGKNIWNLQNSSGDYYYREMILAARKLADSDTLTIIHPLDEFDDYNNPKMKMVVLSYYRPLNMTVGAVTYYTDFKSSNLNKMIQDIVKQRFVERKIGEQGYIWVIDSNGNYVVSKNNLRNNENLFFEKDGDGEYIVQEIIQNSKKLEYEETYIKYYEWRNVGDDKDLKKVSASVYVPGWDWIVGASAYHDDFLVGLREIRNLIIIVSVISIILGSITAYAFAYTLIVKPIARLQSVSKQVSKGNLNQKIYIKSNSELASLADSFNIMTKNLKKSIKTIESKDSSLEELNILLQRKNLELKGLDRQKDEFISIAAHELKTPLTSIKGFAQLMTDEKVLKDKKKLKHYLELVNKNTIRLYNLILDLVDSSRLSIGKLNLDIEELKVSEIFKEIKDTMTVVVEEKGINAKFSMQPVPNVIADSERVLQIVRNLIINATNFTPKGGTVTFNIYEKDGVVQFEIKDTGSGIPKDKQINIFSRFYQADDSLRRKVKGSGLGLSICKGLVELMRGKIWFDSSNKGTTFYFTLPAAKKTKRGTKWQKRKKR